MKKYIKIILLVLTIGLTSCTKVIDIELPETTSRLIVEASIDWKKGTQGNNQVVKLGKSTAYFGNQKNIEVVGAKVVVVKDDDGTEVVFADQNNGEYTTSSFVPELNQSYTLRIEYNGEVYQAKEIMTPVSQINKVEQETLALLEEDEVIVRVFFDDQKGVDNFYFAKFDIDKQLLPVFSVRDDRLTDGNENKMGFASEDLKVGDKVDITLYGVSKRYHNYMQLLIEQAGETGGGSPFTSAPAKLFGNCKNINKPDEEVLGYFRLCEYVETKYTIEENK